jgi:hypothetical protein
MRRVNPAIPIDENALRPGIEDAGWFGRARAEWDDLVAHAGCDPLFNGWAWRSTWWAHFDGDARARLSVLVLRDASGTLCAALPLYRHVARLRGLPVSRLQLLGSALGVDGDNEFSEYCDGCVRPGYERVAAVHFARLLHGMRWHELVSQCVRDDSWFARHLVPALEQHGCALRRLDPFIPWGVDLAHGADPWRAGLSANVRRRAIGQRKRLAAPRLEPVGRASLAAFLDELNACHVARWGKPVYSPRRIAFHQALLELLPADALRSSILCDGDVHVSLLHELRLGGREYNLQSGFHAAQAQQLSPGYLHLGYAIEAAATVGVHYFDMLGGDGKQRAYKADLGAQACTMHGLQVLRARWLRLLYALRDRSN